MRYETLEDYPNYRFYEDGNIVNMRWKEPKVLKPTLNNNGYLQLQLKRKDGKWVTKGLHVLVTEAFHGKNPSGKHDANHKDLDKMNNHYSNLEWLTRSDNLKHYYKESFEKLLRK